MLTVTEALGHLLRPLTSSNLVAAGVGARRICYLGIALLSITGCAATSQGDAKAGPGPRILSAYFGLDDSTPPKNHFYTGKCTKADGALDGMPLVITHEIDEASMSPDDFSVITKSGRRLTPICARLAPAAEENEDRTILLLGEFGSRAVDPPSHVEIVGDVMTEPEGSEGPADNLRGLKSPTPAPYEGGPTIVFAELAEGQELELSEGPGGVNCPVGATRAVVRIFWDGGVTQVARDPNAWPIGRGDELGPEQYDGLYVTMRRTDGSLMIAHPFYIGDRADGDNVSDLCLNVIGEPVSVRADAHIVTDPNNDWNPASEIELVVK